MGKIINGYILPHPPIIVPEIGEVRGNYALDTITAVKKAAKEIAKDKPGTIILSSPHAPCFSDYVYIWDSAKLRGDFSAFGHQKVGMEFDNNRQLAFHIAEQAQFAGIQAGNLKSEQKAQYGISDQLDHGAMVPLYFISQELADFKLVCISTPFMSNIELYKLGKCIKEAVTSCEEDIVYVASGDLSHRLTADAPAGYHAKGREYDVYLIDKLNKNAIEDILDISEDYMEVAGECGTRSFIIMLGAMDGLEIKTDIYSYEGPFGVGYLVAKVNVLKENNKKDILQNYLQNKKAALDSIKNNESPLVKLARQAIETFIKEKRILEVPSWLPDNFLHDCAGVFVSLKKHGRLRGCIGTIAATRENIAAEIINNAISAATQDPRFPPLSIDELPDLIYSVDVLGKPEKITSVDQLDVKRYGVIVSSGLKRGLLLPDLEGIDTAQMQVQIALEKAGLKKGEKYDLERFEVVRYQ
ncbi:MAG: AmmeMemoRadiSam system protein A [Bacillota bacterium]|jgi:AmmeMemoRadiSam system protein A